MNKFIENHVQSLLNKLVFLLNKTILLIGMHSYMLEILIYNVQSITSLIPLSSCSIFHQDTKQI